MSESAEIFAVQASELHYFWNDCIPLLSAALRRSGGERTIGEVLDRLREGQAQLWLAMIGDEVVAACVTQIEALADRRLRCSIWLLGGRDRSTWIHGLAEHIEPWAREIGCTSVRMNGRKGWMKVLPGYRQSYVTLEKALV